MQTLKPIVVFLLVFTVFFFALSGFGALWTSYSEVIQSPNWFMYYSIFLGWWIAGIPAVAVFEEMAKKEKDKEANRLKVLSEKEFYGVDYEIMTNRNDIARR